MKQTLLPVGLLSLFFLTDPASAQVTTLPVAAARPPGSGSNQGFVVKTVQAAPEAIIDNNYLRAIQQLNGTLADSEGNLIVDISEPGAQPGGVTYVDTVDFAEEEFNGTGQFFEDRLFPGLALGGSRTLFSTEVVTFIELPVGNIVMGVTAGFARTDEVNDDGWKLFCGTNPRSIFNPVIAEFRRDAPGFPNAVEQAAGNRNEFTINVTQAGVYPFRLVYWQQGSSAMLEWYIVKDPGGPAEERTILNGGNGSPVAYRSVTNSPTAVGPFIAEVSPFPDAAGVPSNQPVELLLKDGTTTTVDASIKLFLNNIQVTSQQQRAGANILITYNPNPARPNPQNLLRLEYVDNLGATYTQEWQFLSTVAGGSNAPIAGQWDFDQRDLGGTSGNPLAYFDGPGGVTAAGTEFGTTVEFDIPGIDGQPAVVMKVPGDIGPGADQFGYVMDHGISPNGGGTLVNQYTLIMDVFVDAAGPSAASLWQTNPANVNDDGDLFWQGSNFGQGTDGYGGTGQFTAGAWHRVIAAYDMAATPPVVTKYVDGIKQQDWTANQGLDNPRRALQPTAILFADGDRDERRLMYVNSVQIRTGKLTDAEMVVLGGPKSSGIPQNIPAPLIAGQWDFNNDNLAPTIGKPLSFFDGVGGVTETTTEFGTPGDFGIADLPGATAEAPANVMKVPGDIGPGADQIGYIMTHGMSPNGGGTLVNQYTLIMDVFVDTAGPSAASLWQTNPANVNDDGDLFWQGSNFGQGTDGYGGTGQFTAGAWHRVSIAYDMAATPPVAVKYVDGIKQQDWTANQGLDNPRRALQPTAILFADGDRDERRIMYVNSVQIRPERLSDGQLALLGGATAAGIPAELPASSVTGQWDFNQGTLASTVGAPLQFFDGVGGLTESGTQFGLTTDLGVDDIGGVPAAVMVVPGETGPGTDQIGYILTHRIAPNGGGTLVNQYTLIMDVQIAANGASAASIWQTNPANVNDDGDLFWQGNNFGQGTDGYNGTGEFLPGAWHRVAIAYNMAATPPVAVKYVNGNFQDNWTANQGLDNPRRALQPTAVLFADGDRDERRQWWVNSVQIRAGALTGEQLAALGGPQASGIPITIPDTSAPQLSYGVGKTSFVLTWPKEDTNYFLESSAAMAAWVPVTGVVNNSAAIAISPNTPQMYFRLHRKP